MNWYIKSLVLLLVTFMLSPSMASAAVDQFEVILWKAEAQVWESLDITISAVDKNGEIVTDYTWDILVFSESDSQAEFPTVLSENSYSFTTANEWSVKFENAVKFKNSWLQDLYVYDLNDENILWVAEVTITEKEVLKDVEISILSPENGVTLWKSNVTVSGTTQKNYQVRILLNNEQDYFTTSNGDGVFEKELEGLQEWANSIQAFILDADNQQIGESDKIDVKINSKSPDFKKLTINPTGEVEAWSEITIELVSNTGLSDVQIILDDIITKLEEGKDWIYNGTTKAPGTAGEYPIDILLKDEFANETQERWVETLVVVPAPELEAGPEEEPKQDLEAAEEIIEEVIIPDELDLKVRDIKVTELKTKSILTWKELSDAESYNIYKKTGDNTVTLIESVQEARYEITITGEEIKYEDFAIKAVGKTSSWETIQWNLSEMTKVKTGPEMYILMILAAMMLSGWFFFVKWKAA